MATIYAPFYARVALMLQTFLHLLFFWHTVESFASGSAETRTLSSRSARERMQKSSKIPPMNGSGIQRVFIGIYIESMGNFQATDMSFDVDLYLYSHWRDPSVNHSSREHVLVNDPKVRDRLWLPDLYFANARNSKLHEVTAPNFNMFIDRDGNIAYSLRITLNVACNLDLAHYPMDKQTCGIRMLSYAYVESQVNVTWFAHNSTRYNPEIGLPEFKIERLTPGYCDGTYMYAIMENSYKRDKFSCLEAVIHLNRQIGYHMVQSFLPTALIVMISWVSFWIDRRAVPARVTLSFTTLLSLSTLGNGLRFGLPQVAYAKAIDFWFGSCMFFVFLSLVEFAAVNSYMREAEKFERLASYSAKKEMHVNDDNSRWSPDESCAEDSLLINNSNTNDGEDNNNQHGNIPAGGFRSCLMKQAIPSLFRPRDTSESRQQQRQKQQPQTTNVPVYSVKSNGAPKTRLVPNGQIRNWHERATKKASLGLPSMANHPPDLPCIDAADEGEALAIVSRLPSSPGAESAPACQTFTPPLGESRRNIVVPEMQPWPPSPLVGRGRTPQAPRGRAKKFQIGGIGQHAEQSNGNSNSPMATNHFLREGFLYSRKGLTIDKWSRLLFPLAFTLWNIYYWTYYLWYIQARTGV